MGWYSSIGVLGRPKIRMDSPDRSRYGTLRSTHTPISVIPLGTMMNSESPLTRNKYRLGCGLTRGFLPAARASSPRIASVDPVQHPDRLDQLGRHPVQVGPGPDVVDRAPMWSTGRSWRCRSRSRTP